MNRTFMAFVLCLVSTICMVSCKSERQKAAEEYYKTSTLVSRQVVGKLIGAEIDGEIKLIENKCDTMFMYMWLKNDLDSAMSKYDSDVRIYCMEVERSYRMAYIIPINHESLSKLNMQATQDSIAVEEIKANIQKHKEIKDIHSFRFKGIETLTTKINGVKKVAIDTLDVVIDVNNKVLYID